MQMKKLVKPLTELAKEICQMGDMDAAGVVCAKDGKILVIMGGPQELSGDKRAEILSQIGEYCTKCGQGMKDGSIQIKHMDDVGDIKTELMTPKQDTKTDETQFFSN